MEKCKAAAAKKAFPGRAANADGSAPSPPARHEGYNVAYAGNIAYDVTREELIELFK